MPIVPHLEWREIWGSHPFCINFLRMKIILFASIVMCYNPMNLFAILDLGSIKCLANWHSHYGRPCFLLPYSVSRSIPSGVWSMPKHGACRSGGKGFSKHNVGNLLLVVGPGTNSLSITNLPKKTTPTILSGNWVVLVLRFCWAMCDYWPCCSEMGKTVAGWTDASESC